jgi:hypothetical protein
MFFTLLGAVASIARAKPPEVNAEDTTPPAPGDSPRTSQLVAPEPPPDKQESTGTDRYQYELVAPQVVHVYDMKTGLCMTAPQVVRDGVQFEILGTIKENPAAPCNSALSYCPGNNKLLLLKTRAPQPNLVTRLTSRNKPTDATADGSLAGTLDSRAGQYLCFDKDTFDEQFAENAIIKKYIYGSSGPVYGLNLTLPIKIRPAIAGFNTSLSQNIEIGGVLGWRWRLSQTLDSHIDFPVVGIALANLEIEKGRAPAAMDGNVQSMGITASTGVILELKDFQLGFMVGTDRATGDAGRGWVYNGKLWYAFGLGYSFLKNSPK